MNHLAKIVNPDQISKVQQKQYTSYQRVFGTVKAGSTTTKTLKIDNSGDYLAIECTGDFTTVTDDNGTIVDNGICDVFVKIKDNERSVDLTSDFIPLNLLLTPGRVRSKDVVNDDSPYPDQIFQPLDFPYLFAGNSSISFEFKNESNAEQRFNIVYRGVKFTNTAK